MNRIYWAVCNLQAFYCIFFNLLNCIAANYSSLYLKMLDFAQLFIVFQSFGEPALQILRVSNELLLTSGKLEIAEEETFSKEEEEMHLKPGGQTEAFCADNKS